MDDESHTTCLSPDCHDENIKDHLFHFLGCIEISERHNFLFDSKYKLWQQETKYWINKLQQAQDKNKKLTDNDIERKAMEQSQMKREAWRDDCLSELRRIDFLRFQLKVDQHEKHLVDSIKKSRDAWEKSKEFQENIDRVKAWGASRRKYTWKAYEDVIDESAYKPYEPGRDVNAPFMQLRRNPTEWVFSPVNEEEPDRDIWGKYPNQKTNVQRLLYHERGQQKNLLSKIEDSERLKYFHVPSNNMAVSTLFLPLLPSCIGRLLHLGAFAVESFHICTRFWCIILLSKLLRRDKSNWRLILIELKC